MLVRSITATTALALIAIVAAEPEPDRPRIYFPRQVKREFYNSSVSATDTLTTPDNVTPSSIESTTSSTTSGKNLVGNIVSNLLGSKTTGSSSTLKVPTATRVASTVDDKGSSDHPKVVVTRTSGKTSSSLTSKPNRDSQDGSKSPTAEDTAIVIAPTGIVAPTSSSSLKTESKGRTASSFRPTATNKEPVEPVPRIGDLPPSPPPKDAISGTGSSPSSVPTSRHGTPVPVGTGVSSTVVPPSSTKPVVSNLLDPILGSPVVGGILPTHSGKTAVTEPTGKTGVTEPTGKTGVTEPTGKTGVTEPTVKTSFVGTAPESSYIKPDPVATPTGGVAPVLSKSSATEPTKTSVGAVPDTTLKPDTTSKIGGLVPIPSKSSVLDPLDALVSNILPGPSSVNSTVKATESSTEPTVPPPIAVLPTGSSPKALLPTESTRRPKGASDESPTTLSPIDSLSSSLGSVLPTGFPTSLGKLPLSDASSTTPTEVTVSPDGPVAKPTGSSPATTSIADKNTDVPVVNSTTPETATVAPTSSNPPSAPSDVQVVNSTGVASTSSLPTGPVTSAPTTSSEPDESAKPTYAGPESSSSKPTASPSPSQPSSVSKGTKPSSNPPRPVESSTAVTSTSRAPPASTVHTESKPIQPPPPETSLASPPPSQPTTASTPQPFPTWIPKYFTPNNTDQPPLDNSQNITIGFQDVVSAQYPNDKETVKFFENIIRALPYILSLSFNSTVTDRIRVSRVEVCNDRPLRNAIALVSFPNDNGMIEKLQMDLELNSSPINQASDSLRENAKGSPAEMEKAEEMIEVIKKIDHNFDIRSKHCRGRGSEPGTTPGSGDGPRGGNGGPRTDTFGNPMPKDGPTPQSRAVTGGIVAGAVGFSVMYGAAMFIVARRYKRKKQAHRRSNSVTNSQNSSEMRYTGGASPALMGGALVSREYMNYGAGGRDSHGSGRSGMGNSGRTANISAPVAAENSLGWN